METYEERQKRMDRAFKLVQPTTHWKDPINKVLYKQTLMDAGVTTNDIHEAVTFFTGTPAQITEIGLGDTIRVVAKGYRAGPCGDH